MAEIRVRLEGQLLTIQNQEIIASGNVNYDICIFAFDKAWEGFVKTAVFYQDKAKVQYAVLGSDGTCAIPAAAMTKEGNMYFGVFGVNGTKVITSTVERVYIRQGAISGDTVSAEPGDDIFLAIVVQYQQIMEQMQAYDIKMDEFIGIMNGLNAYDVADVMKRLTAAEERLQGMDVVVESTVKEEITAVSGGLRFAQDGNGEWGYVAPGSGDVIPFGGVGGENGGTALRRYPWELIEDTEIFTQDEYTWKGTLSYPGMSETNKQYLFFAISVSQACKAIMTSYAGTSVKYTVFLNDELKATNTNTSNYGSVKHFLELKKGINYLFLECYMITGSVNNSGTMQLFLPPVAA